MFSCCLSAAENGLIYYHACLPRFKRPGEERREGGRKEARALIRAQLAEGSRLPLHDTLMPK